MIDSEGKIHRTHQDTCTNYTPNIIYPKKVKSQKLGTLYECDKYVPIDEFRNKTCTNCSNKESIDKMPKNNDLFGCSRMVANMLERDNKPVRTEAAQLLLNSVAAQQITLAEALEDRKALLDLINHLFERSRIVYHPIPNAVADYPVEHALGINKDGKPFILGSIRATMEDKIPNLTRILKALSDG